MFLDSEIVLGMSKTDDNWTSYFEVNDLCQNVHVEAAVLKHLHESFPSEARVSACELGCGDGSFGQQLTNVGKLVSVDPFVTESPHTVIYASATDFLRETEEKYDLIFGKFFIHLCGDLDEFMSLVKARLTESGKARFYSMSSESALFGNSSFNKLFFTDFPEEHVTRHTSYIKLDLVLTKGCLREMVTKRVWSNLRKISDVDIERMERMLDEEGVKADNIELWLNVFEV